MLARREHAGRRGHPGAIEATPTTESPSSTTCWPRLERDPGQRPAGQEPVHRKTDASDAAWLVQLGAHDLVGTSFIPPEPAWLAVGVLRGAGRDVDAEVLARVSPARNSVVNYGSITVDYEHELAQLDDQGPSGAASSRRRREGDFAHLRDSLQPPLCRVSLTS
ncbi:hypothetical protein [Streptomyces sp. NPDC057301]|uniref:hypothetical protein n=1 Tax=Streptomyces sp. NPDC057301 TaxID=3346093 RepID=UPI0036294B50